MRVITGKFKGRKLVSHKGDLFRPTLDKVKESIFNVLGDDVIDANVLDLFCGCGSLGLEAQSRGAMRATFIDNDKTVMGITIKNIEQLDIGHKSKFILSDAFKFLESHEGPGFDIIFADPPYADQYGSKIIDLIVKNDILKPGSIFVLERFKKDKTETKLLKMAKQLNFGQTEVDFYIRED